MLKIYKKIIVVERPNQGSRLESSAEIVRSNRHWLANLLAVPALMVGALFVTVFFSLFFALFLIPVSILGLRAWWSLRKLKQGQPDQTLEAEYTVISETVKKTGPRK